MRLVGNEHRIEDKKNLKTYKNLWDDFISEKNIREAIHNASLGKKSKHLKRRLKQMNENPDKYIEKIRFIASHYKNGVHTPVQIYDGIQRKRRTIIVPNPYEQVVHHMAVNVLKPMMMHSMYHHSYGSIPNRGSHAGKKQLCKWLPSKYVLKMDVKKYFDSVSQDILIEKLEKKIKDERFMEVLRTIIHATETGIPLGFYTSQWFANFYLTDLDHYITSELGFGHYMRYMDDMVVLGNNKRKLHELKNIIEAYLRDELSLTLKENWQIFRFDYLHKNGTRHGRGIDFMGFWFFRNKIILRKSIMLKAARKAKRISKKEHVSWYDACQMVSYCGWFKSCNTYGHFEKRIKPYVNIRVLKKKISHHSRKAA